MEDLQMQLEDAEKRASEHWDLATEKDILYDKEVCKESNIRLHSYCSLW